MSTDKAVILAAGRGTRMQRPANNSRLSGDQERIAEAGVKAMMPVGRPFIEFVLTNVADAGISQVCLVIAPGPSMLREHCQNLCRKRLGFEFAIQEEPRGTADALVSARRFVGDDTFLMINADNYYPATVLQALTRNDGPAVAGFTPLALSLGNIPSARLHHYALLLTNSSGQLGRVIEKPDPTSDLLMAAPLINMNCWRFSPAVFDACQSIAESPRGEYELTDAVNFGIATRGLSFRVIRVDEPVLDLSTRDDVSDVTERLKNVAVSL